MLSEIYQHRDNGMEPKYYMNAYRLGAPTSPQTANQLEQFGNLLNQGIKNIEVGTLQWETFESIPKEHLTEIRRLSELTETKPSVHAPIIEPSGFTQQGWSEESRINNEREIMNVVERAHELDKEGNVPIALHGGNIPAIEWEKGLEYEGKPVPKVMYVVNQETGQIQPLTYEKKMYPEYMKEKGKIWTPYARLGNLNESSWDQEKLKVMSFQKEMTELEDRRLRILNQIQPLIDSKQRGVPLEPEQENTLRSAGHDINLLQSHINELRQVSGSELREMHHKLVSYVPDKENKESYERYEDYMEDYPKFKERYLELTNKAKESEGRFKEIIEKGGSREETEDLQKEISNLQNEREKLLIKNMADAPTPEVWRPIHKFAIEKVSNTLSNVAFQAYEKFGDKAPIIAVENSYPYMPLARADDLRKGIEETRRKLAEKLVEKKGLGRKEAENVAEKLIGATWDVGHINMMRKSGYNDEEVKELIREETKQIAPFVKHVHINDNFGFTDVHLPPGMGTSPIKEQLKILEKLNASPEKIRHIVESGGFVQHFKESPWPYALEELGSPLYSLRGPYWPQMREIYAPYMMGYGEMLPEEHFKLYGSGFSGLPRELGGQVGGERSRFTGTPTA
ncbi:MAG: hypothetical protein AABY07_02345 [Nanoarchaeota archaeon]